MQPIRALPFLCAALLLGACGTPAPRELARLGTACQKATDCGSGLCLRGLCTRGCLVQGDCPDGFDCGQVDVADSFASCYRAAWTDAPTGGFGADCSANAGGCGGAETCAQGFACHHALRCDAKAVCTKACTGDPDCPPTFFCGRDDKDGAKQCLRRTSCEACGIDDQCPPGLVCATSTAGERFCAKTCEVVGDCLKPNKDSTTGKFVGAPFQVCTADTGIDRKVCAPGSGHCHGPSPLPGMSGDGLICSPCRLGHPEDCAGTAPGSRCFEDQSGERFCTQDCKVKLSQGASGYSVGGDPCPTGSFCYFGGASVLAQCGAACSTGGVCVGDSGYTNATCYPLQ